MDYDKTAVAATYDLGRDHGPAFLQQWMDVVATHMKGCVVKKVLDLGCGTGRFSQGLASQLDAEVIGVDPSSTMLAQARKNLTRMGVLYASGCAEALPLPSDSVDMIFISMAFHHFTEPKSAAQECRRVLREGGRLCLRTASREQIDAYPYVPYFPASRVLLEERLPSLRFQCDLFESVSLRMQYCGIIMQQIAANTAEYVRKIAARADSILIRLSDADFDAGLQALGSKRPEVPVVEPIDFVVFEKE
jgi:ubiquinone/menaquinone biosynthesis C-methylase UbiE